MPTPKYRTSASKRDMRRSHDFLRQPGLSFCSNCQAVRQPHCVCPSCGFYKGKQVFSLEAKQESFGDDADLSSNKS